MIMEHLPASWKTLDVHNLLREYNAEPVRIDMSSEYNRPGRAKVVFRPPPANAGWIKSGFDFTPKGGVNAGKIHIRCRYESERPHQREARLKGQRDEISIAGTGISFGVIRDQNTMLVMRSVSVPEHPEPQLVVNLYKQQIDIHFSLRLEVEDGHTIERHYVFRIPFTQLHDIKEDRDADGRVCFTITPDAPPLAFRKTGDVAKTHTPEVAIWDERQTWYRQVSILSDNSVAADKQTQLQNDDFSIDIGRWLSYRFVCKNPTHGLLDQIRAALASHNIPFKSQTIQCTYTEGTSHWNWLGSSEDPFNSKAVHLPFAVRYQLEACISQGCLHESTLDATWAQKLLNLDAQNFELLGVNRPSRAAKLLEKVLESKKRFYNPMDIFEMLSKVSFIQKKVPRYCTMVRSATVTPTTIYFNSPSVDTSNRVVRKYHQHEDRFLRVKFRDENYKGTIMTFDDDTCNELFTRVKRTMKNGIVVGDRHYEFLAYGNSQFREHGAYFFEPTSTLTPQMIRDWMGNFEDIQTIAKYASRLGLCFSTTRAMSNSVTVNRIDDIKRNGHYFTDGVGKISPFLAQMTAQEMGLPSFGADCPSVFQFRLGGCKGVLAIDPGLKGQVIEVRPSQEKFPATYRGLEICRVSQFATAYLNQQIVLVLSALGVRDAIFMRMLRGMLAKLDRARSDGEVALEVLQQNIDLNQSTIGLANMILDGFMTSRDPFFVSCLHLWRAWSIKYLKEKAKLFVEKGAFVFGVADETGTLKGHSASVASSDFTHDVNLLPEIFLQVPDLEANGKFKAVEGVCVLARNPSLHPGDLRMVRAVNAPKLSHLRNTVVLPTKGDRDIASMCSGGDLDGDDYLVIWDPDLIPEEWNHAPMDYSAPPPVISDGPVTVDDMTSFFVTHMKNDNLGRIATAHRYWADKLEEGVKHDNCLELAALHSKAVDYAKTGVPAEMPKHLKVFRWPHWAEKKEKSRTYHSNKILGQMYDEVERVPFEPAWDLPFDVRILEAYEVDDNTLASVREVKREYDEAIRRLMKQHAIKTEFEVWTIFILEHNHESRDFKIAEEIGETIASLKRQFQELCYQKADTTMQERDREKLKPFIVGMYIVTAQEVAVANERCAAMHVVAGRWVPKQEKTTETMPLMSFPWLFQRELGMIANNKDDALSMGAYAPTTHSTGKTPAYIVGREPTAPPPTKPSISTSNVESENLIDFSVESQPLATESASAKPLGRQDSKEPLIGNSATHNSISPASSPALDSKTQRSTSPAREIAKSALSDSSAFAGSDGGVLDKGLAEIESLPAESSGEYENQLSEEEGFGKRLSKTEDLRAVASENRLGDEDGFGKALPEAGNLPAECSDNCLGEEDDCDDEQGEEEPVTLEIEESAGMKALNKLYAMYG